MAIGWNVQGILRRMLKQIKKLIRTDKLGSNISLFMPEIWKLIIDSQ